MFNAVFPKKTCIRSPWGNRHFGVPPLTPLNLTLWGWDAKTYILRTLPGNCYVSWCLSYTRSFAVVPLAILLSRSQLSLTQPANLRSNSTSLEKLCLLTPGLDQLPLTCPSPPWCSSFTAPATIFLIYLCDLSNNVCLLHWSVQLHEGRADPRLTRGALALIQRSACHKKRHPIIFSD